VSPELLTLVDEVAAARFGGADLRGPALARAVQHLHAVYTEERARMPELAGNAEALCARLRFFLPRDLPKVSAPLHELLRVGALPSRRPLRVLDLGAGLGACTLGALEVLADGGGVTALRVDAVDVDAAGLELARTLCERRAQALGVQLTFKAHTQKLSARLPAGLSGPYDLILLGFVLNELAHGELDPGLHHATVLRALGAELADDGVLIALEPALRSSSRALQQARGHLIAAGGPPHVFAPCLHASPCPLLSRDRDWCHERLRVPLPEPVAAIARQAGLRESDLSYSYLTLCAAPRSLAELSREPEALLRVVTAPLASKGKLELGVCSPGPLHTLRLLDRHARRHASALEHAGRGNVLQVRGAESRGEALLLGEAAEVSAL
jgi:ribosomal protein RSM22 (predicted rRNA methylase)